MDKNDFEDNDKLIIKIAIVKIIEMTLTLIQYYFKLICPKK